MTSIGRKAMKGRRLRATRLDGCGRPVYGDCSQVTSSGWVSAAWTANTLDTDEINQTNANGDRCLYEGAKTSLTGYTLVLTFCEVDPEVFELITGQRVIYDSTGMAIGIAVNTDVDTADQGFALEIWAGSPTGDACTDPNAQGSWGYFLSPYLKGGILGDYTVENGAINFTIQGAVTQNGNNWGDGPYDVILEAGVPSHLPQPLEPNDHKLLIWTNMAPPEAFYGCRPLMDPEAAPITAVVGTVTAMDADFTFTGGALNVPVWIDFGDGAWDYVASGLDGASHTYAKAGTYAVKATSNGTWVTTNVTIA